MVGAVRCGWGEEGGDGGCEGPVHGGQLHGESLEGCQPRGTEVLDHRELPAERLFDAVFDGEEHLRLSGEAPDGSGADQRSSRRVEKDVVVFSKHAKLNN